MVPDDLHFPSPCVVPFTLTRVHLLGNGRNDCVTSKALLKDFVASTLSLLASVALGEQVALWSGPHSEEHRPRHQPVPTRQSEPS